MSETGTEGAPAEERERPPHVEREPGNPDPDLNPDVDPDLDPDRDPDVNPDLPPRVEEHDEDPEGAQPEEV